MSYLEQLKKPFREDEIEWRIAQSGKSGDRCWAKVLAYVQARAIMDRLDETCGLSGWKVSYDFIRPDQAKESGVVCCLSLKIGDEWITKEDGAEQTDFEAFKGGISSALKRAAVLWGMGRYLYGLEEGFARIVDKNTKGARYAKTKEGEVFFWIPPELPKWALPEDAPAGRVAPQAPEQGDGISSDEFSFQYRENAGESYHWTTCSKLGPDKCREVVDKWDKQEAEGKKLTKKQEEIRFHMVEYVGSFENQTQGGFPVDQG